MSELNTSQREKLILLKEMIDNSLIRNENSLISKIQKLCMQLTIEETLVVRPARGAAILLENSFFRDLLSLVKSEEFQAFYTQHMNRSIDHKPALIYLELYQVLQKIYVSEYDVPMTEEMSALVLQTIMRESQLRKPLISLILSYLDGKTSKKDTYKSIKNILISNKNFLLDA
jgi:hypothetical protein